MPSMREGDEPITADNLVRNYYAEATFWHMGANLLDSLVSQLRHSRRGGDKEPWDAGYSALRSALYERELEAFRNLFMFSLVLDSKGKEAAKEMAYDRFLREGYSVIHHLDPMHKPSGYSASVEKEFRAFLATHFGRRDGEADSGKQQNTLVREENAR